jgi:hypothetical protein
MKAKILLRVAAVFMLLHTFGHTVGALTWKQAPDPAVQRVVDGMQQEHFPFMGRQVSLGAFFDGYGFSMIAVLLLVTLLLWMLSTAPVSRMILVLGFFLLFLGNIEFIYFFPFAAAFTLLAGISTLFAYQKSKVS